MPNQDIVFQALFGTKGSEKILGGLLTNILGEKVDNISLDANQNLVREVPEEKLGIVDLRANVGDKTTVHIELQMTDPYNMFKRLLWYWARIYGVQLKNTENYSILKKTIAILIVNYDISQLEWFKDAHTIWQLLEKRNPNITPFEDIEIHILELPKIKKYQNETEKNLNTWLEFLSNPESEEVKVNKEKNKELKEAYEKLEYISEDEELRRQADRRLIAILDENSRKEGNLKILQEAKTIRETAEKLTEEAKKIQQNAATMKQEATTMKQKALLMQEKSKEKQNEWIRKMKSKNIPLEEIVEITGLTEDEIDNIV